MEKSLRFREDGTFTVVQFTDVHWINGEAIDGMSRRLHQRVLEKESPDLVVFTGDMLEADRCEDPRQAFREVFQAVEEAGVPWAFVFGNHDTEAKVTRRELMALTREFSHCMAVPGPEDIDGIGNYVLPVYGRQGRRLKNPLPAAALYCFDSGSYAPLAQVGGYDWLRRSQIDWYEQQAAHFTHGNGGRPLPAYAFMHIPLPEYEEAWQRGGCIGSKREPVCCPRLNTGLFARMVEAGDIAAVFAGHDHTNDYQGELYGIQLVYGRASGYNTPYGGKAFTPGARVIRLREGQREIETWLCLEDGAEVRVLSQEKEA